MFIFQFVHPSKSFRLVPLRREAFHENSRAHYWISFYQIFSVSIAKFWIYFYNCSVVHAVWDLDTTMIMSLPAYAINVRKQTSADLRAFFSQISILIIHFFWFNLWCQVNQYNWVVTEQAHNLLILYSYLYG